MNWLRVADQQKNCQQVDLLALQEKLQALMLQAIELKYWDELNTLSKRLFSSPRRSSPLDEAPLLDEAFDFIEDSIDADNWNDVANLLDDLTLLINTDTGGQAEFLDLHASHLPLTSSSAD